MKLRSLGFDFVEPQYDKLFLENAGKLGF